MSTDNPAELLQTILNRARQTSAATHDETCLAVWQQTFNVDGPALSWRVARVALVAEEARALIGELNFAVEEASANLYPVVQAAMFDPGARWSIYWAAIHGDNLVNALPFIAEAIRSQRGAEDEFPIDNTEALLARLRQIAEEVDGAQDLDEEQRRVVKRILADLIDRLEHLDVYTTAEVRNVAVRWLAWFGVDKERLTRFARNATATLVISALAAFGADAGHHASGAFMGALPSPDPEVVRCISGQRAIEPGKPQPELEAPDDAESP
jgi:hypothetical protein